MIGKKSESEAIFAVFLLMFVGYASIQSVSTFWHEQTHKQIYLQARGNATVSYKKGPIGLYKLGGGTHCSGSDPKYIDAQDRLDLWNEIIGYNIDTVAFTILLGSFLISVSIILHGMMTKI